MNNMKTYDWYIIAFSLFLGAVVGYVLTPLGTVEAYGMGLTVAVAAMATWFISTKFSSAPRPRKRLDQDYLPYEDREDR